MYIYIYICVCIYIYISWFAQAHEPIHVQGLDDSAGPFCLRRAKQVPYWLGQAAHADRNPLPVLYLVAEPENPAPQARRSACHMSAMAGASSSQDGSAKLFSGESEDGREYKRWKVWVTNKLLTLDSKIPTKAHGASVYTLLSGKALECVEHLEPGEYQVEGGEQKLIFHSFLQLESQVFSYYPEVPPPVSWRQKGWLCRKPKSCSDWWQRPNQPQPPPSCSRRVLPLLQSMIPCMERWLIHWQVTVSQCGTSLSSGMVLTSHVLVLWAMRPRDAMLILSFHKAQLPSEWWCPVARWHRRWCRPMPPLRACPRHTQGTTCMSSQRSRDVKASTRNSRCEYLGTHSDRFQNVREGWSQLWRIGRLPGRAQEVLRQVGSHPSCLCQGSAQGFVWIPEILWVHEWAMWWPHDPWHFAAPSSQAVREQWDVWGSPWIGCSLFQRSKTGWKFFLQSKNITEIVASLDSHRHMSAIHVQGLDDSAGPFCLRRAKQVPYWLGQAAHADRNPLPVF